MPRNPAPAREGLTDRFAQGTRDLERLLRALARRAGVDLAGGTEPGFPAADADRPGRPSTAGTRDPWRAPRPLCPSPAGPGGGRRGPDLEVTAPARRSWQAAPAGTGERYRFRSTDGPESRTVLFGGDEVVLPEPDDTAPVGAEAAGAASGPALFLRHRLPATAPRVTGDATPTAHCSSPVPPVRRAGPARRPGRATVRAPGP
ncbi:hypothetical protein ACFCZ1_01130 [Streptomyces sp. NPDC056224]|uniref:hypothetical protein n=1 Tax=Streptomyces sp. NPDC056224 TaxID=3345750 RepID=UPI0035E20FDD